MKYALFLGCTVPVRTMAYEISTRNVMKKLGISLADLEDFGCCGFPLESIDHTTYLSVAARNLAVAEAANLPVMTMCSACNGSLLKANLAMQDKNTRDEINANLKPINRQYKGTTVVKHAARVLYETMDTIKEMAHPLNLKVAAHYGCHYTKPSEIYADFEDPEVPYSLEELISAVGATPIPYENKKQCCGGSVMGIDESVSLEMVREKLSHIKKAGADAMVLVCPFCDVMYDINQKRIENQAGEQFGIPVLFLPQLIGLALGLTPDELGLKMNRVSVRNLLKTLGDGNEQK
ncbi:MAG: CoB--CoM heterodisulfide reductase subunit B [Theionarchaea archaeon]|nr:CoB--CoM heterodisulfide reductase subunit B [Theionarchaea archaeon]MBU7037683.1 CoB--CoM heterodisulfide reductase subunit B [Theionarchaea archaeon]